MQKSGQKKGTQNSKIKLALTAIFLLIILLVLAKFVGFLSGSDTALSSISSKTDWDGISSLNLLYIGKDQTQSLSLINFQPKTKEMTILNLSGQIYFDLPKNFGNWRLGSIFDLGEEDKKVRGPYLLKLSVSKLVGLPLDGVVLANNPKSADQIISDFRNNPLSISAFFANSKTDLTVLSYFRFLTAASNLRPDKLEVLDLAQSNLTQSRLLPDSSRVLGIDAIKMDVFIRDKLADKSIFEEGATIGVFNATTHPGLAQEVSRIITNMGGNVVIVGNLETKNDQSYVAVGENSPPLDPNSLTLKRLNKIYSQNCGEKCKEAQRGKKDPVLGSSRAQINVIIGEDYYKMWYEK